MKIYIFYYITPLAYGSALNMEAKYDFKTSVDFRRTAWCLILPFLFLAYDVTQFELRQCVISDVIILLTVYTSPYFYLDCKSLSLWLILNMYRALIRHILKQATWLDISDTSEIYSALHVLNWTDVVCLQRDFNALQLEMPVLGRRGMKW
jgi:hypothetical protein